MKYIKKSINLLLISLEALDIYALDSLDIKKNHSINISDYNYYISNKKQNYSKELIQSLKYVYNIYYFINTEYIQSIISKALNDYCNNIESQMTLKYLYRFKYIYSKKNYYYYKDKLKIKEIALSNLYIINQIQGKYGFYKIIKYLYTEYKLKYLTTR